MLKCKSQTLTYLRRELSIKSLGGNHIEIFTHVHTYTHTQTHTCTCTHTHTPTCTCTRTHTHTQPHTYLKTRYRTFFYAIYVTDMLQTYITDITVNGKDTILSSLLQKRLSKNRDLGNKVKTKEVEVQSWIFSFLSVYASNLSYVLDKMNLPY